MVGHTHEDIDQIFRVISEELTRRGFVGTIEQYLDAISSAFKTGPAPHVEQLDAVADYKSRRGWASTCGAATPRPTRRKGRCVRRVLYAVPLWRRT